MRRRFGVILTHGFRPRWRNTADPDLGLVTHRYGGSCRTGCARCGWWTSPSLLRVTANVRDARVEEVACIAGRPLRPNRQNLDSAIFSLLRVCGATGRQKRAENNSPLSQVKNARLERRTFSSRLTSAGTGDPVRAVRDSDGASSDARERMAYNLYHVQMANAWTEVRRDSSGHLASRPMPPEPLVPKTHHRPIPLRLECSKTPRPSRSPSPPSRGSTRRRLSRRDSGRKTRSGERRDTQPPRTTTTQTAWQPATPPSRRTPPPPPDKAEDPSAQREVEARDRTRPNTFVRVSPCWKINSRQSAPRGSALRTRWRSVCRDPRDSVRPTSAPSRSSRPERTIAVVYLRRHHNGPSCAMSRFASRHVVS